MALPFVPTPRTIDNQKDSTNPGSLYQLHPDQNASILRLLGFPHRCDGWLPWVGGVRRRRALATSSSTSSADDCGSVPMEDLRGDSHLPSDPHGLSRRSDVDSHQDCDPEDMDVCFLLLVLEVLLDTTFHGIDAVRASGDTVTIGELGLLRIGD